MRGKEIREEMSAVAQVIAKREGLSWDQGFGGGNGGNQLG